MYQQARLQVITSVDTFDDQNRVKSTRNKIKKPKHCCRQVKQIGFRIANDVLQNTIATNKHEIKQTLMDTEQKLSKTLFLK